MRSGALRCVAVAILLALPAIALAQADVAITHFVGSSDASGCGGGNGCGSGPYTVTPGGHALFYLEVTNAGPGVASNVVATVTFPPHTTVDHITTLLGAATCTSSLVGPNPVVTCTQSSLSPSASFSANIQLNLNVDYPWQGGLSASASVTAASPDSNLFNNNATANLYVAPPTGAAVAPILDVWSATLLIAVLALSALLRITSQY